MLTPEGMAMRAWQCVQSLGLPAMLFGRLFANDSVEAR